MGLDMYLTARNYLTQGDWNEEAKKAKAEGEAIGAVLSVPAAFSVQSVELRVGYWRKANAIHAWFVKNVQDGKDDCGYYYVSREKLVELLAEVEFVLEGEKAEQGFFFGGTDYDEWYMADMTITRDQLRRALEADFFKDSWSFFYHSSW